MKTTLTELLEYLQKDYDGLEKQKTEVSKIFKIAIATVMKNIEDLYLSKEKKQIMEDWENGYSNGVRSVSRGEPKIKTAEEYYNKTFTNT